MDDDDLFSTFMSQYADNPYEQDLGTPLDAMDNETAKFYRQQALAQSGESPLAGMGPGAGTFDLTNVNATGIDKFLNSLKGMGGKAMDFAGTPQGIMSIIAALAAMADRRGASGGGTKMGMPAPRQYTRTMTQGQYGPIARYAAEGGLMKAYAQGGEAQAYAGGQPLMMEDGGFVFTEKATKALGPQGIASLGGKMISAPGNGTNDKGITGIIGKHGVTPARVSDKESYFPEEAVAANGGPKRMYAKMNALQRKA